MGKNHADRFVEPSLVYDSKLKASPEYINSLPDLQNGPSSLIKGAPVVIQEVGIHHFRLPLTYRTRYNGDMILETSVTGTVSLDAHKKGINMSAPSKANVSKLDNPARVTANHRHGTEPCV